MAVTTTRKPTRYIVQWRTASGWRTLRGYKTEAPALRKLQGMADSGTYRVITGDPHGAFDVIGMRCPAVPNDPWVR
jgi:hypothetical protein